MSNRFLVIVDFSELEKKWLQKTGEHQLEGNRWWILKSHEVMEACLQKVHGQNGDILKGVVNAKFEPVNRIIICLVL